MKKSQIAISKIYTDGKGRFRMVTNTGPQFRLFPGQAEHDCLSYRSAIVLKKSVKVEKANNSTTSSFASWTKAEIAIDDLDPRVRDALLTTPT